MSNIIINDSYMISIKDLEYDTVYYCVDNKYSYILVRIEDQNFLVCLSATAVGISFTEAQKNFKSAKFIKCNSVNINVYGNE